MIRYGQYGRKARWIVKRYENMEETEVELWNDMENTDENVKWYGKYGRKAS